LAWEQFILKGYRYPEGNGTGGDTPGLEIEKNTDYVKVSGKHFELLFNMREGMITSFKVNENQLLRKGPKLNIWRAPTDNDGGYGRLRITTRPKMASEWIEAGLDRLIDETIEVSIDQPVSSRIEIRTKHRLFPRDGKAGFNYTQNYTIDGKGRIMIETDVRPFGQLPSLPRIGLQLVMPGGYERLTWYGRGPHETYVDRLSGARMGLYKGTVDEQFVPYVVPQENGNKTDVRWVSLTNNTGEGLKACGTQPLETSVHHYSTMDLSNALHLHELQKLEEVYWNIDYRQGGLGGNSAGPRPMEKYQLKPEPVSFIVILEPTGFREN
jgi:hypothetical protein